MDILAHRSWCRFHTLQYFSGLLLRILVFSNKFGTARTLAGSRKLHRMNTLKECMKDQIAKVIFIDPIVARKMLDDDAAVRQRTKRRNRKLTQGHIDFLAREMEKDLWRLTGQAISFNSDGELDDGQHRLHAIIQSGKTIPMYVVTGLSVDAFGAYDANRRRSIKDAFTLQDYPYSSFLSGVVTQIINWEQQRLFYHNRAKVSAKEALLWADEHPKIVESCRFIMGEHKPQKGLKPGLLMVMHYLFRQKSKAKADYFIERLLTGKDLTSDDDVIYRVREMMLGDALSKRKLDPEDIAKHIVKAWNLWREGASPKLLNIKPNETINSII